MRGLTIGQPFASLIAEGVKRVETRGWTSRYRGPLLIHAGANDPAWVRAFVGTTEGRVVLAALEDAMGERWTGFRLLPRGAVVAVAELVDVWPGEHFHAEHPERAYGDLGPGRYGLVLRRVRVVDPPVPARGMLGLWVPKPETLAALDLEAAPSVGETNV